jgi:anti-sigma regulatory factor (Ser/Thr protein kinase)
MTLTLRSGPASVRSARRFTDDLLSRWGLSDMRDDVLLCLSELVSNAVVYGGSGVGVRVGRSGSQLRLEVSDHRPLDDGFLNIVRARQQEHAHPPTWQPE